MKLLLAIFIGFAGCAHHATVAKVAHVAVSGASFETGKPTTDPETISRARSYLQVYAASLWIYIPTPEALSNAAVGQAIHGALPPNTSREWRIRVLVEAEESLAR